MRRTIPALILLAACGSDSPDPGKCYQEVSGGLVEVACPDAPPTHAAPLCVTPGGESVTPVSGCAWTTPTPVTPTSIQYGTGTLDAQTCDKYAAPFPTGADARVTLENSGFTGGSRTAAQWVRWAQHNAAQGIDAYVCSTRLSAAGSVYPMPAPNSDARCILRTIGALSPTHNVRGFAASAGATLIDHADATADRTSLTSGTTTITLDDGTCAIGWASTDAAIVSRLSLWSEPGDLRVKNKINPGAQPNMDQYLNVTGEADPNWMPRATIASPVLWYRATMAPRLVMASNGDGVVYRAHTVGSGFGGTTCATDPSGLAGTMPSARAAGVNATAILNACPIVTHLPAFGSTLTSGECTSDIF